MLNLFYLVLLFNAVSASCGNKRFNEFIELPNHTKKENYNNSLPHTYVSYDKMPKAFDWGNVNGTSYITHSS